MQKLLTRVQNNKFLSAAFWVFLGTAFLNFGSYLYHLLMGRMLPVASYGALEGIISLLYILFVPTLTLALVIVKFTSAYLGREEHGAIQHLYSYLLGKIALWGSVFTIFLILISPFITSFLKLPNIYLAVFMALTFLVNLFYILDKSLLQGLTRFFKFSLLNVVETVVKLTVGIGLVYIGFSVNGAFAGIAASLLFAWIIARYFVKNEVLTKINTKATFPHSKELLKFAIPTFITTLALTSFFTMDVILVRYFFHGVESGYYSALSVLGKVIYFAASPVILVVFPLASEFHARGGNYTKILFQGLAATLLICGGITFIYYAAPDLMVKMLFGEKYLAIAGLIGLFGLFISIYTVCALLANFYLSIHKVSSSYIVAAVAILQIILLILFHESLQQVIYVSILSSVVLLICLLLYYPHASRRTN